MLFVSVLLCLVEAYLLGSINFAIIITKLFSGKDIRSMGSGNAGMTNVLRNLGKGPAVLTFLGDFSKGMIGVLLARLLAHLILGSVPTWLLYLAAIAAVLGHSFPVYHHFKGGKGVAVSTGTLCAIAPIPLLCAAVVFAIVVAISKIVSAGSIFGCVAFALAVFACRLLQHSQTLIPETVFAVLIAGFIIYLHRENIKRLIHGQENSFRKK